MTLLAAILAVIVVILGIALALVEHERQNLASDNDELFKANAELHRRLAQSDSAADDLMEALSKAQKNDTRDPKTQRYTKPLPHMDPRRNG